MESKNKTELVIERIKRDRYKSPMEKVQHFKEEGYRFEGCFIGGKGKTFEFACHDCGNPSMFKMTKFYQTKSNSASDNTNSEINICSRCNSTNVNIISSSKAKELRNQFKCLLEPKQ